MDKNYIPWVPSVPFRDSSVHTCVIVELDLTSLNFEELIRLFAFIEKPYTQFYDFRTADVIKLKNTTKIRPKIR